MIEAMQKWSGEIKVMVACTTTLVAVLLSQNVGTSGVHERINDTHQQIAETNERLDKRIDETNKRIDETNERIDETNERIDETNERITHLETHMNARFDRLEEKLDEVLLGRSSPDAEPNPEANVDKPSD